METYDWMERALADPACLPGAAAHDDWRVRYAAAVAMGRLGDPANLPHLRAMLAREEGRPLYSQPRASFPGTHDDTRMAERILAVRAVFDRETTEEEREAWKCRGRVKQACLFAIGDIGVADAPLRRAVEALLADPDDPVRMAAFRALGRIGDAESLALIERMLETPEHCSRTEAQKAHAALRAAFGAGEAAP